MKHSHQIKAQFSYNKIQVLYKTGMTPQEYGDFQVDTAKAWADRYFKKVLDTDALLSSTAFWQWWVFMWADVDDQWILNDLYVVQDQSGCYMLYRQLHQFVFDDCDQYQKQLMADFNNMRQTFKQTKTKAKDETK